MRTHYATFMMQYAATNLIQAAPALYSNVVKVQNPYYDHSCGAICNHIFITPLTIL